MPPPRRRPRWVRRLLVSLGAFVALVIAASVAAWLCLPLLVTQGYLAGTRAVGGEKATIVVERADLSGVRAQSVSFQLGGLSVAVPAVSATYSVSSLLDGRAHDVSVDGLAVTLDFTRPRRGILPDAIEDLMAQFGGGGELVWPVDSLTLRQCALVLRLPGREMTIDLSGRVVRRPDGFLDVEMTGSAPDTRLQVSGRIRTETMDGELRLDHMSIQPSLWLELATVLGVAQLPAGVTLASGRIECSGTTSLEHGVPVTFSLRLDAPGITLAHASATLGLSEITLSADQPRQGELRAEASCHAQARAADGSWYLDETLVHTSLVDGVLRGGLAPVGFSAMDVASGRTRLQIECGIPALGGPARARADATFDALRASDHSWAPVALTVEGWTDRLVLTVPRLALADASPLEAAELQVEFSHPFGAAPALAASCEFIATPALLHLLPAAWSLVGPSLPCPVAHLQATARAPVGAAGALEFSAQVRALPETVQFVSDGAGFSCRPSLSIEARGDELGASMQARIDLTSLTGTPLSGWRTPEAVSAQAEISRVSFAVLSALAEGREPSESIGAKLSVAASGADQTLQAALGVTHDPVRRGWEARLEAQVRAGALTLAGGHAEDLGLDLSIDSGLLEDALLAQAIHGSDTGGILSSLAARSRIEATANAAQVSSGVARLEWLSANLAKHPADTPETPVRASLEARASMLRAGPESIEQPALHVSYAGGLTEGTLDTRVTALLEGATLGMESQHALRHEAGGSVTSTGTFELHPLALINSDVLSRWIPEMKGVVLSGTLAATGTLHSASQGAWDGTAQLRLTQGRVTYPAQDLQVDGVFADVDLQSLATCRTRPAQRAGFARLAVNDVVLSDGLLEFRADSASVIHVEGVGFHAFDGSVRAEPFSLYFPEPDVALDLSMKDLDAGALVRTFDLFNGSLTGRLQGRLPVGLLAGKPIIGEGFLELQPEQPARLVFDSGGLFTEGLPNRTWLEKINRLPNELVEQGLANLQLRHFRIDLFRRDRPDRPIEIHLGGVAHTSRADVPLELEVRLNGSMAEVIDLLVQLIML